MKPFKTGVVIGKFLPPHRGHKFLIDSASAQVENLTVIICEHDDDFVAGAIRAEWLREIHPEVRVLLIHDHYNADEDSQLWARLTIEWLGYKPDVAFTSENYGQHWARYMGCQHVLLDLERQTVPISATKVRAAPLEQWEFLEPIVRAHYARRICVLGAESTGSTTLSQALAAHFKTNWVPEYGREYCETHWIGFDYKWKTEEFTHIAQEQTRRENLAARECNRILICDTNAFATRLWHERYFGVMSPEVDAIAAQAVQPDLYVLTDIDIPFVQDGLRDGEYIRADMHRRFVEELGKQNVPWILVSGSVEQRLEVVVKAAEQLVFPLRE